MRILIILLLVSTACFSQAPPDTTDAFDIRKSIGYIWQTVNTNTSAIAGKQNALGYTPYNSTNPSGYISGITGPMVTNALGYTPYNATNPNGYISSITSGNITTALGYTPLAPNGSTTGSAATLTTPRNIYGNAFDGSAALTQIIASTFGGTGNGFTKFSGPATSEKTFTLPNTNANLTATVASADIAATASATSTTTLFTPSANGFYRVTCYLKISTTGTSPVAGPVTISYQDADGSVAQSHVMLLQSVTGTVVTTTVNNSTTTGTVNGSMVIYAKSGVAIQYAIAVSGTFGAGRYVAHLRCEQLN